MYTVHFYSGSHGQELRDKMGIAMDLGAAIIVTEWAQPTAPAEAAHWPDKFITSSGLYVRSKLLDIPYEES